MRQAISVVMGAMLLAGAAHGQESRTAELQGQVFFSAMRPTTGEAKSLHLGGGFGVPVGRGFSVGMELGHLYTPEKGTGMVSANGSYHFRLLDGIEPFAVAGYTRAFSGSKANLVHFGGGVTHWLNDHGGVRLEMRDYVSKDLWPSGTPHTLEFRIGVVFR